MNKEKVEIFNNEELNLRARAFLNPDGSISINAEDTAIGFGWIQTQAKRGKEYTSVRWERMNGFSAECGFPHKWGKDDFIPENVFYRLAMKAKMKLPNASRLLLLMKLYLLSAGMGYI